MKKEVIGLIESYFYDNVTNGIAEIRHVFAGLDRERAELASIFAAAAEQLSSGELTLPELHAAGFIDLCNDEEGVERLRFISREIAADFNPSADDSDCEG
jgi:hypothetical protein